MSLAPPSYAEAVLRLVGLFLVLSLLSLGSSGAHAQKTPEPEAKPLITPPKLIRFVEAALPDKRGEPSPRRPSSSSTSWWGRMGGSPRSSVARSGGEAFDEGALAAARQFVFEPARKDWEPIAARIRYRYVFELKAPPEEMTTGWLSGTILLAEDDSAASSVAIEISTEREELVRELVSGPDGTFVATDLEPGKYEIHILGGEYGDLEGRGGARRGAGHAGDLPARREEAGCLRWLWRDRGHRGAAARSGEAHDRQGGAHAHPGHARGRTPGGRASARVSRGRRSASVCSSCAALRLRTASRSSTAFRCR